MLEAAQRLAAAEAELAEWAGGTLGVRMTASSISLEGVAAAAAEAIRDRQLAQRVERDAAAKAIADRASARLAQGLGSGHDPGPLLELEPPSWTLGREGRRKLSELGLGVRGPDRCGEYSVFATIGRNRVIKADQCASEDLAWRVAGQLCGELAGRGHGGAS